MADPATPPNAKVTPQQVTAFLQANNDFFQGRDQLLALLKLPLEESGTIVSLPSRQAQILQQKNLQLRDEIGRLYEAAEHNQRIFANIQRLITELVAASSLEELDYVLTATLKDHFRLDASSLTLFDDQEESTCPLRVMPEAEARQLFPRLFTSLQPLCGILSDQELEFLFPADIQVQSAAAIQLTQDGAVVGLLALGSHDVDRFRSDLGTIFLEFIRDVLSLLVTRLKQGAEDAQAD